jgi:hypothetical protein
MSLYDCSIVVVSCCAALRILMAANTVNKLSTTCCAQCPPPQKKKVLKFWQSCIGLTTLPPSCAGCLKIWEPQPPGKLRACAGLWLLYLYLENGVPLSGDTVTCQSNDMLSDVKLSMKGKVPGTDVSSLPWELQLSFSIPDALNDWLTDLLSIIILTTCLPCLHPPPHWKHDTSVVVQNSFIQNWLHIYIPYITFWFCLNIKIFHYLQQYELPTSLFFNHAFC